MKTIKDFMIKAYETAKTKGFYDTEISFGDRVSLIHSEVSEMFEEYRNNHPPAEMYFVDSKPEGIPAEAADICIRIFDMCQHYNIDLEEAIKVKMAYNATRPYKHGGKKI